MRHLLILCSLFLTGCVYIKVPVVLPLPQKPNVPLIQEEQLSCLTDEAYEALAERDILVAGYAKELEAVIKANNEEAAKAGK